MSIFNDRDREYQDLLDDTREHLAKHGESFMFPKVAESFRHNVACPYNLEHLSMAHEMSIALWAWDL